MMKLILSSHHRRLQVKKMLKVSVVLADMKAVPVSAKITDTTGLGANVPK